MKGLPYTLLCTLLALPLLAKPPVNREKVAAVTYEFSGGRFGDQLLSYMHGKWVSYHNEIPLLYKPFLYSDQLLLDDVEQSVSAVKEIPFHQVVSFAVGSGKITKPRDRNILYTVPYFPESLFEHTTNCYPYIAVNWEDAEFKRLLQSLIKPKQPLTLPDLPKDSIHVAIHVRTGGGYDDADHGLKEPLRVPPYDFYVEQIKMLYKLFPKQTLSFYIFTDDQDPRSIATYFEKELLDYPVHFSFREKGNAHDQNVLEDFFNLTRFDCLIRPESNFSITAEKIANYCVVISPKHFTWIQGKPHIDAVQVLIKHEKICF